MKETNSSMLAHFSTLQDPRRPSMRLHKFEDLLVIAICAVICGANHWTEVEDFARAKEDWFSSILELPAGIPSHDTFNRVFSMLPATPFEEAFVSWVRGLTGTLQRQVVSLDGKTLRGSARKGKKKRPFHLIHAWSGENKLVLAQKKVRDETNEITVIPEVLDELLVKGCIITLDAIGCQKSIARKIREKEADYVLSLKQNQKKLHSQVETFFDREFENDFREMAQFETSEKGHGREEHRVYWLSKKIDWLEGKEDWEDLKSIGIVWSQRVLNGEESSQYRYFLTSLEGDVEEFAKAVRQHWQIENQLHWTLDVAFREDESRLREGNGAENFALLRKIGLNVLRQDTTFKRGINRKRNTAGWDHDYLLKLLYSI